MQGVLIYNKASEKLNLRVELRKILGKGLLLHEL